MQKPWLAWQRRSRQAMMRPSPHERHARDGSFSRDGDRGRLTNDLSRQRRFDAQKDFSMHENNTRSPSRPQDRDRAELAAETIRGRYWRGELWQLNLLLQNLDSIDDVECAVQLGLLSKVTRIPSRGIIARQFL
jgi:hypothetical protein